MDSQNFLKNYVATIDDFLASVVPNKPPKEVYEVIRGFLNHGGKRLRAALCLLSAEAVGGSAEEAVVMAGTIELFHAFTLIHDDIMDDSKLRRGQPCVHVTEGIPIAINAADVLFLLAVKTLRNVKLSSSWVEILPALVMERFQQVFEGQAEELSWIRSNRWDIMEADYIKMVEKKTAALISLSAEAGAMVGGGSQGSAEALRDFGRLIGIAFQIQDDLLNLVGTEEKYQKEIGGDITEGKRSLMIIYALAHLKDEPRQRLIQILSAHTTHSETINEAIGIVRGAGSFEYVAQVARKYCEQAEHELLNLPPSSSREVLTLLAQFVVSREG